MRRSDARPSTAGCSFWESSDPRQLELSPERSNCRGSVVPFDRHRLVLEEVEPGHRFLERSSSWLQRLWQHERIVEPHPEGCRVTDRIMCQPRLPLAGALTRPVVDLLFRSRHRVLRRRYNPQ